jgi:radical SAM-linked protein
VDKIRLRFTKTGKAAYISHLDLMRTAQRALNRAGVPIRYSEGFNPHALISILLPLPVGMESLCELMDIRVREERDLKALPALLTKCMPEGIQVMNAREDGLKSTGLKWLRVRGILEYDGGENNGRTPALQSFFERPSIPVLRKTKSGEHELDLKSALREVAVAESPEGISLTAALSAQEPTVNPELLIAALRRHAPDIVPDFARFTRLETLGAAGERFR